MHDVYVFYLECKVNSTIIYSIAIIYWMVENVQIKVLAIQTVSVLCTHYLAQFTMKDNWMRLKCIHCMIIYRTS